MTDQNSEGNFEWIIGEPVTYTNWNPGEPNDCCGGEDYGVINWHLPHGRLDGVLGDWNDAPLEGINGALNGPENYIGIVEIPPRAPIQPPSGLVSWWPGDGNANDIVDSNHGTLEGGATFAPGMVGQAFSFDGVDDFVEIANPTIPDALDGSFTVDLWFKTEFDINSNSALVAHYGPVKPPGLFHIGPSGTGGSRVPGSGVIRGRGSGERETTASSLAGKEESSRKEDNSGQGKDGPAGAIAQGGNGR